MTDVSFSVYIENLIVIDGFQYSPYFQYELNHPGESKMLEREVAERIQEELESGNLLPSNLRAKVRRGDFRLSLPEGTVGVDLLVEFKLQTSSKKILAVIECKSHLTLTRMESAVHHLQRAAMALERELDVPEICRMVAAPYIPPSVQETCKELDLGYIDLNGNFHLTQDELYFDIVRRPSKFRRVQGVRNIYLGKSRRILRVLLTQPHTPFRVKHLATEAETSVAQVSYVLRRLQEDRLVEKSSAGSALVRPGKLLRVLVDELSPDYEKNRRIYYGFAEEEPPAVMERLARHCQTRNIEHAFALFSGLEKHERNVIATLTALYVSVEPKLVAEALQIPFATMGSNIFIMRPPSSDNTSRGGVFYRPRMLSSQIKAVNLVQAYIDFMLYSGRGKEQAQFIFDRLLAFRT